MLGDNRGCCELKVFDPSVLVHFVGKKLQKFFITRVFYLVVHDMLYVDLSFEHKLKFGLFDTLVQQVVLFRA